jgi:cytochrome P450
VSTALSFPDLLDPVTFCDGPPRTHLQALAEQRCIRTWSEKEQMRFWAVGAHREVSEFVRDWRRLSSQARGTILSTDRGPAVPSALTDLDPPRHTVLRRAVTKLFKPAEMQRVEALVRNTAQRALAELAERGSGDFVTTARTVPAEVIGELLGIPPSDRDEISYLGHLVNFVEDPAYADVVARSAPAANLSAYAHQLAAEERRHPSNGLVGDLLATGANDQPITVPEFEAMFVLLVAAGNGTTIDALVSAVRLLSENPHTCSTLEAADAATYRNAVEEILRWATPVNYFARTATEPIPLDNGVRSPPRVIDAGERVALYFAAANFDERAFPNPLHFDITRSPNPHLTFGQGAHACLGAPLARLELRVVLEELCRNYRIDDVEAAPRRIVSHINNGYAHVRVALRRLEVVR